MPKAIFAEQGIPWNGKKVYTRTASADIQPEILKRVYRLPRPQAKTPTFTGQSLESGNYVVLGLYSVQDGDLSKLDKKAQQSLAQTIERRRGEMIYDDFVEEMKAKTSIETYPKNL